jgi:hypothetical protein
MARVPRQVASPKSARAPSPGQTFSGSMDGEGREGVEMRAVCWEELRPVHIRPDAIGGNWAGIEYPAEGLVLDTIAAMARPSDAYAREDIFGLRVRNGNLDWVGEVADAAGLRGMAVDEPARFVTFVGANGPRLRYLISRPPVDPGFSLHDHMGPLRSEASDLRLGFLVRLRSDRIRLL